MQHVMVTHWSARPYIGKIRLYLDGEQVEERAAWAVMPQEPNVRGYGAVGLYPDPRPTSSLERDTMDTHTGIVHWEWLEEYV